MQQQWTERGIKGAKYLAAGVFLIMAKGPALNAAQGSHLALAVAHFVFGVIGPILVLPGLYLVATRNKQPKNPPEK